MARGKLPERIYLGPQVLRVVETEDIDGDAVGEFKSWLALVNIRASIPGDPERANAVLHECLHAAFKQAELGRMLKDSDGDHEEMLVNTMSNAVIELFRRNPELLAFVTEAVKSDG